METEINIGGDVKYRKFDKYAFLWSEARLTLAAIALFIGGIPLALKILPFSILYRPVGALLTLSWLISGFASLYLLHRWNQSGRRVFGGTDKKDTVTFFVMIVSGINLGLVSVLGTNLGMSMFGSKMILILTGLVYLYSLYHLHKRWKSRGEQLF